jgi:hypothetical protein
MKEQMMALHPTVAIPHPLEEIIMVSPTMKCQTRGSII